MDKKIYARDNDSKIYNCRYNALMYLGDEYKPFWKTLNTGQIEQVTEMMAKYALFVMREEGFKTKPKEE